MNDFTNGCEWLGMKQWALLQELSLGQTINPQ